MLTLKLNITNDMVSICHLTNRITDWIGKRGLLLRDSSDELIMRIIVVKSSERTVKGDKRDWVINKNMDILL